MRASLSSPPLKPAACLPAGRTLVVPRVPSELNRATPEEAAAALVNAIRKDPDVLGPVDLSEDSSPGADWPPPVAARRSSIRSPMSNLRAP